MFLSADSTKPRIAFDEIPWASGVLLGKAKPAAWAGSWKTRSIAVTDIVSRRKLEMTFAAAKVKPAIKPSITHVSGDPYS
jgi:hypothetical protein